MISALLLAALVGTWSPAAVGLDPMPEADLWRAAGIVRAAGPRAAPPLELENLTGHRISLGQLRGRVVLVYFWGSW